VNSIIIANGNMVSGRSIVINNGKVIVDGKNVELPDEKTINITIHGDLGSLSADSCGEVKIDGSVGGDVSVSQGRASIGGEVAGGVHVSQGNVDCGNVRGDVSVSMGNITSRRG
jgi:autotransporter translocation and assembly factor TamB